jgi:hypothetical protein
MIESRDPATRLIEALLDALTLEWSDRGNIKADTVREYCTAELARALNYSVDETKRFIEKLIQEQQ